MVIGIIGAGLSGLTAGKILADAGHEVMVIEKNRELGGKLATLELDDIPLDYGISHLSASGERAYMDFLKMAAGEGILKPWENEFAYYDSNELLPANPNKTESNYFCAPGGMQTLAQHLSRWVDVKSEEKAGGLTHIGADRSLKKAWMINLTDISVFECDAVIIAAPAPEAYGILQTSQNETAARRIIRHIDEISYDPCYSMIALVDRELPEWKGIECEDEVLSWIGNESTKRDTAGHTAILMHSTPEFARKFATEAEPSKVENLMLQRASDIFGEPLGSPVNSYLHFWKYFKAQNPIDEYFMELEMEDAPLALIGDYYMGNSVGDAFMSGYTLAQYWKNKYSEVTV